MLAPVNSRSTSPATERVRLLVKEADSAALTGHDAGNFDQTFVIAQMPGELPTCFAQRAIHRIAMLERSGREIASATLLTGGARSGTVHATRRLIALALARHAEGKGSATALVIEASAATDDGAKRLLVGLVDELLSSPRYRPVPVRLRFASAASEKDPKSGVYPRANREPS